MNFPFFKPTLFYSADQGGGAPGGADPGTADTADSQETDPGTKPDEIDLGAFTDEQIENLLKSGPAQRFFQSENDKIRTAYAKKLKTREEEIEKLKTEKMTESQKREYEISKREKEIREKAELLTRQQVEIAATNSLVEKEIPLSFREFVMDETPEKTAEKVENLSKLWKTAIDEEVQRRFAEKGRTPGRSHDTLPAVTNMNDLIRRAARR